MSLTKEVLTKEKLESLPIVGEQPKNEREAKYLNEICEYEFYNLEETGTPLKFPYGSTTRKANFYFMHGGKYKVPRHVARHIESRSTPRYEWRPNGMGGMEKTRIGDKPRFQMRQMFA